MTVKIKLLISPRLTDKVAGVIGKLQGEVEETYLATKRNLYWNRDNLSQQTTIEGHHKGHWIIIGKHQCHLGHAMEKRLVRKLATLTTPLV